MDGRRWSSYQPNVPGRGIVAGYTARFWAIVVVLGVVTGVLASALVELLRLVEHIAYGYRRGSVSGRRPGGGRLAALRRRWMAAAVIVIVGGLVLGRPRGSEATEVSESLWLSEGRLPLLSSLARGVVAIVTVGLGSSMGRESAPQLAGAAVASWLSEFEQLPVWQRRLLVASGAGAGFAAIYNVPLGGALFALEVLLGTVALPFVLPALATSVIATAVAWITLGTRPTYDLPHYLLHPGQQLVFALLAGPIIGFAAVGWVRAVKLATRLRPEAVGPVRRAGGGVRRAGGGLAAVPGAAGQRQGRRPGRGARRLLVRSAGGAAGAQAAGDRRPVWAPARRAACSRRR